MCDGYAIVWGRERSTADIEIAHHSASLCHLANIAARRGQVLHVGPKSEVIMGDSVSDAMRTRTYRKEGHWAIPKGV